MLANQARPRFELTREDAEILSNALWEAFPYITPQPELRALAEAIRRFADME